MKDFKTYLRETRNEQKKEPLDEIVGALLLVPTAMNLFPTVFKGGFALGKGIKKLWDMNQKRKKNAEEKAEKDAKDTSDKEVKRIEDDLVSKENAELDKALADFDPDDEDTVNRIKKLEDDIQKRRDPKQYRKDLQAKIKKQTDKLAKDNKKEIATVNTDDAVADAKAAKEKAADVPDDELGAANDKVASAQDAENAAKEKEKEIDDKESEEDKKPDGDKESEEDKKPDGDNTQKKINKLETAIKNVDNKERKKNYEDWISYYKKVLDSDDPSSVEKPKSNPPNPKSKSSQKESYLHAVNYWVNK